MKVAILSMQRIINYGSVLQAYGLKKIIEGLENEVEFIDIEDGEYHEVSDLSLLPKKKKNLKWFYYGIKNKKIESKILNFQKKHLKLKKYNCIPSNKVTTAIIGSDEVFNCYPKSTWGITLQLYGKIPVSHVSSYAASCGYFDLDSVPKNYLDKIGKTLKTLDYISVRDNNTYDFVKKISGRHSFYNLDPVLIYNYNDELKKKENKVKFKKKYMIVYAYRDRINNINEINKIKEYAANKDLEIYCIGGVLQWCKNIPALNPFQVLNAFRNAECIVTDTFHGCVFSIKYNKNFAVIIRDSNNKKICDLLDRLQLNSQLVHEINCIDEILSKKPDYSYYNNIIKYEIDNTNSYLAKAIK